MTPVLSAKFDGRRFGSADGGKKAGVVAWGDNVGLSIDITPEVGDDGPTLRDKFFIFLGPFFDLLLGFGDGKRCVGSFDVCKSVCGCLENEERGGDVRGSIMYVLLAVGGDSIHTDSSNDITDILQNARGQKSSFGLNQR
ncbi:hypothetical protein G7K_2494-t1 [Saitoella complicata NRRL Y-17804]|uniref:Uncharacterized protein n=1 Tax=Saitoella complicata (strain BCRC 22490 / CBS 7301 / JCM 7358 / NBRC 10748 / NRRL Y-17804) TaxID=698492 RepID=A0A0E9NES3_SAICN|nr:hypothetical protein G7K_2494-t1 [Saitoella complicata NRRL Y-17804]